MKKKTLNATVDVQQDHFDIDERYCVVFQERTWSTDNKELRQLLPKSSSGYKTIKRKDLKDFYDDKNVEGLHVQYATDEDLEYARTHGFQNFVARMEKTHQNSPTAFEQYKHLLSLPDLKKNLVIVDFGSHQLRNLDDQYLPTATFFSYIENRLSEGSHDLDKVVRLFQFRSDIVVVDEKKLQNKDLFKSLADGVDVSASRGKEIFEIPYYNAEEDRTQSVQFLWQPEKEDFQEMMGAYDGKYKSIHQMARDHDIFGLSCCEYGVAAKLKL